MKKQLLLTVLAIALAAGLLSGCADARAEGAADRLQALASFLPVEKDPAELAATLHLTAGGTLAEKGTLEKGAEDAYQWSFTDSGTGARVGLYFVAKEKAGGGFTAVTEMSLVMTPGALDMALPFGLTGEESLRSTLEKMDFPEAEKIPLLFGNLNGDVSCILYNAFEEYGEAQIRYSVNDDMYRSVTFCFEGTSAADSRLCEIRIGLSDRYPHYPNPASVSPII